MRMKQLSGKQFGVATALAASLLAVTYAGSAHATPGSGFTGTTITVGRFASFDVANVEILAVADSKALAAWRSLQRVAGPSDVYVQNNTWAVGGHTGWHTHPGHSLIIVTAGEVTVYEGGDPTCAPRTYGVGEGFVDAGGDHVHLIRNEGTVEAKTMAVQLIPAGATRRVDADANAACGF